MKPFEALSDTGQVRRLRRLAQAALQAYGLQHARCRLLQHVWNTTFRVEHPGARSEGHGSAISPTTQLYVLRIHHPSDNDHSRIQSELQWLETLRRDARLLVPDAVRTSDGKRIAVTDVAGVPGPRCCVLFHWIEGEHRAENLTRDDLVRVGGFLARLHRYAEQFVPPPGFDRVRLNADSMFKPDFVVDALARGSRLLAPGDDLVVQAVIERVQNVARELGEGPAHFGLIHGDFQPGNFLFHHGEVRAIDFNACHFGYYLYDMAVTIDVLTDLPACSELRSAFLQGYRRIRPLSRAYFQYLETFVMARRVKQFLWTLYHAADRPEFHAWRPAEVQETIHDLRAFLA